MVIAPVHAGARTLHEGPSIFPPVLGPLRTGLARRRFRLSKQGFDGMDGKGRRRPEELERLIRRQLAGKNSNVPIKIERSGRSWIAVADVGSVMTRERIEAAAKRVREFNDLA